MSSRLVSIPGATVMSDRRSFRRPVLAVAAVLATTLVPVVAAGPAAAASPLRVLFVSPSGDDANTGTNPLRPVRTPERARDLVRTLNQQQTSDIVVLLLPGTYRLTHPLELDGRDSGGNGHRVIWTGLPLTRPVISGGVQLTGWHPTAPGSAVWAAAAPPGLATRQLFVDGVRAHRASGPVPVTLTATATGYTTSAPTMAGWRNPGRIEFVYTGGEGYWNLRTGGLGEWTEPRCPIAASTDTTITMAQPCWDNSTRRVTIPGIPGRTANLVGPAALGNNRLPMYAENAFELLDQPGEWYLDSSADTVYYIPRAGEDLRHADVEVPVLETLVSGHGTADAPIHDVSFRGLQFSYGTWLTPSTPEGFSEIQANYTITGPNGFASQGLCQFFAGGTCPFGNWTRAPANVSFSYDHGVEFLGDVFTHLGAAGLDLGDGSQDGVVKGCVFTDISGNGLALGGVDMPLPPTTADRTSGNQIVDNHLYALPVEYHGGVAIDVGYTEHTTIAHNQIDHTAYSAISMGWGGWPDKIQQPATPNYSNNNVVADNLIRDPMQMLSDGGGIYTQGITGTSLADGEHRTGNVITGTIGHGHALYTDNGATFVTMTGNVLFGNASNDWGSRHTDYRPGTNGSDPTDFENNYWQQGDRDSSSNNVTLKNNRIITSLDQAPRDIIDNAGLEPPYGLLLAERVSRPSVPDAPSHIRAFATDSTGYVSWNPTFVDHGLPVTRYTVTASPGGQQVSITPGEFRRLSYAVVPGLTNGTAYTFTVTASNALGTGPASLPSGAVNPAATNPVAPGRPTNVTVNTGDDAVSIHFNPPSSVGSTPIIGYTITAPGLPTTTFTGHTVLWADSSRNIYTTVGGLQQLTPYTFSISAVNANGTGQPVTVGPVILAPTTACAGAALTLSPRTVLARPGSTATVTATLTNGCTTTLHGARLYAFPPAGYTVSPAPPVDLGDLAPGQSASQPLTVTVPPIATSSASVVVQAVFTDDAQARLGLRATATVNVPAPSFAATLANVGTTDDANAGAGDIDGSGSSLSAQALAAAGVTPGGTVTAGGLAFTWPSAGAGQPDNAVASGQGFDLTGSGSTLGFLVTATYGPASGTGQVVYSDGSAQPFTISAPDWFSGGTSPDIAVATAYRNRPSGRDNHPVFVFLAKVALDPAKTVRAVVLPDVSAPVPVARVPSLHVFAVSIGGSSPG
jgi:hypothetical protein